MQAPTVIYERSFRRSRGSCSPWQTCPQSDCETSGSPWVEGLQPQHQQSNRQDNEPEGHPKIASGAKIMWLNWTGKRLSFCQATGFAIAWIPSPVGAACPLAVLRRFLIDEPWGESTVKLEANQSGPSSGSKGLFGVVPLHPAKLPPTGKTSISWSYSKTTSDTLKSIPKKELNKPDPNINQTQSNFDCKHVLHCSTTVLTTVCLHYFIYVFKHVLTLCLGKPSVSDPPSSQASTSCKSCRGALDIPAARSASFSGSSRL